MKKVMTLMITLALLFTMAACSNQNASQSEDPSSSAPQSSEPTSESSQAPFETPSSEPEDSAAKALVVYFSWSGNTESVANEIVAQTGADEFEITPATPYTDDYDALLDIAQEEKQNDARPAISGSIENLDQYDVVYVGFPNWWGDMPMILYSFFDAYDLSGKTVAPFVTSGGSGFSGSINTMKTLEPDATIADGLSLGSSQAANPGSAVTEWLSGLGLSE